MSSGNLCTTPKASFEIAGQKSIYKFK